MLIDTLIELKQRNSGFENLAVDFGGTDFEGVARAMGGAGVTVSDRKALSGAIEDALQRDTYSVIACTIDKKAYDGKF